MVNGKLKMGWGSWYGFRADVEHELADARKLETDGTPADQIMVRRAEAGITDAAMLQAYREQVLRIVPDSPKPAGKKEKHKHGKKDKTE